MSKFYLDLAARKSKELVPNGRTQTFWGEQLLVSRVDFEPHVQVPEHQHPHEQFGVVLSGQLTLNIGGERHVLRAGEMFLIPGNVPHGGVAGPEGFVAVEVFSPVREDLKYE
jgi:quercetin dioxygenase-like cupin family protein